MTNAQPGKVIRHKLDEYADGEYADKHRYMLLVDKDAENDTLCFVNLSKIRGKERKLQYKDNFPLVDYRPLPEPSFAILSSEYIIDDHAMLLPYYINGAVSDNEMERVLAQRAVIKREMFDKINTRFVTKENFIQGNTYKQKYPKRK